VAEIFFSFVVLGYGLFLIAGFVSVWIYIAKCVIRGEPIVRKRTSIPATWGLLDIIIGTVILFTAILFCQFGLIALAGDGSPVAIGNLSNVQKIAAIWGQVIAQVFVFAGLGVLIYLRGGRDAMFPRTWSQFLDEVRLGLGTFLACCIPVLIVQIAVSNFQQYEHPLINFLLDSPEAWVLVPVVVAAVVVAPITEEFAMRMMLQGWLEDTANGRLANAQQILTGHYWPTRGEQQDEVVAEIAADDHAETITSETSDQSSISNEKDARNPYAYFSAPEKPIESHEERQATQGALDEKTRWAPIIVTSIIFGLLHVGQGLAPVPLCLLAFGLGYIYQKTRTLTASIVVHMMLNGQSMALLIMQIVLGIEIEK